MDQTVKRSIKRNIQRSMGSDAISKGSESKRIRKAIVEFDAPIRFPNICAVTGVLVIVYGGDKEGHKPVYSRRSTDNGATWSESLEIAKGIHYHVIAAA